MNHELLFLIRQTGYLTDADLSAQARYDLLTRSFWLKAAALGYNVATLKRKLWRAAGRPEELLIQILPEAAIQKAARRTGREKDPRKSIKETAAAIFLAYKKGEKEILAAIDNNLETQTRCEPRPAGSGGFCWPRQHPGLVWPSRACTWPAPKRARCKAHMQRLPRHWPSRNTTDSKRLQWLRLQFYPQREDNQIVLIPEETREWRHPMRLQDSSSYSPELASPQPPRVYLSPDELPLLGSWH